MVNGMINRMVNWDGKCGDQQEYKRDDQQDGQRGDQRDDQLDGERGW